MQGFARLFWYIWVFWVLFWRGNQFKDTTMVSGNARWTSDNIFDISEWWINWNTRTKPQDRQGHTEKTLTALSSFVQLICLLDRQRPACRRPTFSSHSQFGWRDSRISVNLINGRHIGQNKSSVTEWNVVHPPTFCLFLSRCSRRKKVVCVLKSYTPRPEVSVPGSPVPSDRAPLTEHAMRLPHSSPTLQRGEILIEWKDGTVTPLYEAWRLCCLCRFGFVPCAGTRGF